MIHSQCKSFYPDVDAQMLSDAKIPIINFMTPSAKMEGRASNTVLKHNTPLREMFAKMLQKNVARIELTALIYKGEAKMTYRELDERSEVLARYLGKLWLPENGGTGTIKTNTDGDAVVLLCCSPNKDFEKIIIVFLAIIKLGLTFMPINPEVLHSELCRILQTIDPCMIITDSKCTVLSSLIEENDRLQNPFVLLDKVWSSIPPNADVSQERTLQFLEPTLEAWTTIKSECRTVAIYFTAGSSGFPRPVRIGMRELFNLLHWKKKVLPPYEYDIFALTYPPWDVNFLSEALIPILQGLPLVLLDKNDIDDSSRFMARISESNVSRVSLSTPDFSQLIGAAMRADRLYISTVKIWVITGNALPLTVTANFLKLFLQLNDVVLLSMYGTVEVVGQATYELYEDLRDLERKTLGGILSVGTPICNTDVLIVDERDKCLPMNVIGEIAFSGSCVCSGGYSGFPGGGFTKLTLNGDEEPKRANRLFRTGDLGRIIVDTSGVKRLYVMERVSNCIKHENDIVDWKHITDDILQTGMVQTCHALPYNHGRERMVIIAACILKDDQEDHTDFFKHKSILLKDANSKVPWVVVVPSIPLLSTGRVDCENIRQMYRNSLVDCDSEAWKSLDLLPEQVGPAKTLCRAVATNLAIPLEQIIGNFEFSFWDMGGSSVEAIGILKYITKSGYPVGLQDIVCSSSISQILDRMIVAKMVAKADKCVYCHSQEVSEISEFAPVDENQVLRLLSKDFHNRLDGKNSTVNEDQLNVYWKSILKACRQNGLCAIARDSKNKIVGVLLGISADAQIKINKPPKEILYPLELFQACKKVSKYVQWRETQKRILQVYFIALDHSVLPLGQDAVLIFTLLHHTEQIAKEQGFGSFVIEATNPVVQEVCANLKGMKTLFEFPIKRFKSKDKSRPFIRESELKKIGVYCSDFTHQIC